MASNFHFMLAYLVSVSIRNFNVKTVSFLCCNKQAVRLCLLVSAWMEMGRSLARGAAGLGDERFELLKCIVCVIILVENMVFLQ